MTVLAQQFTTPRVDRAEAYVAEVLAGRVAAGRLERLACERHLRDLDASAFDDWPWRFDRARGERVCRFIEGLRQSEGGTGYIRLAGWQCFVLGSVFGWVDKQTGLRRFRTVYLEVGRKNGKSTLLGGVALYCLALDGEVGAKVYSAATTKDQARKVFDPAKKMAAQSPDLVRLGVKVQAHKIVQERVGFENVFEPLPAQTRSLDGANPSCTVVDELHAHSSPEVWEVMGSGQGARTQPLLIAITTAGANVNGVCFRERQDVEKILRRVQVDESYFGVIFTLDEGDDPLDPANWRKANPNLRVSLKPEFLSAQAAAARRSPTRLGEFRRKHCCVWSAAGEAAFDVDGWTACADPELALEDLRGCDRLTIGVDGSKTSDLTSLAVVGWRGRELLVWDEHWATDDEARADANDQLVAWESSGHLTVCPGALIDMGAVEARLGEIIEAVGPAEVLYDPTYLVATMQRLEEAHPGVVFVEWPQQTRKLDPSLRLAQGLVRERRVRHRGNPVMTWMMWNTRTRPAGDYLKIIKLNPANKIDGAQALVTALGRMDAAEEAGPVSIPEGYFIA